MFMNSNHHSYLLRPENLTLQVFQHTNAITIYSYYVHCSALNVTCCLIHQTRGNQEYFQQLPVDQYKSEGPDHFAVKQLYHLIFHQSQ